jgi:hypothetical protein
MSRLRFPRYPQGETPNHQEGKLQMTQKNRRGIVLEGIVRHYHVPGSNHTPYTGLLKTIDDHDFSEDITLGRLLDNFPDGEHVTIKIERHGKHKNAENHVWIWTKPNTYERRRVNG